MATLWIEKNLNNCAIALTTPPRLMMNRLRPKPQAHLSDPREIIQPEQRPRQIFKSICDVIVF